MIVTSKSNGRFSKLKPWCKMFKTKKFNREENERPGHKAKKRRFSGNQHTRENETLHASTSAQKLMNSSDTEITIDPMHGYRIINFIFVFSTLRALLKCKKCESDVKFNVKGEQGLGFKLCVVCDCGSTEIESSPKISNKSFEINRRIVFVMRLLGIGLQGINLFCGMMDLGQGIANSTYYACLENALTAAKATADVLLGKAAKEEIEKNAAAGNEPPHLTVSGDGTWSRRGFSSLFGVVTLIGKYSSKILDLVVKSKFCQSCNYWSGKEGTEEFDSWYEEHEENCACNHTGSAGKMEVDGIIEMFTRSEELHDVKYTNYIGDGDTKTFKSLLEIQPYGEELIVTKKECVGHVKKRMGSRLRSGKKKTKGVGGKGGGKLTDKLIRDLTNYYGLAIIRNSDSVTAMKNAIWATFDHKCSTDAKQKHDNCPPGPDSWCNWRRAEAGNKLHDFKHEQPLATEVQKLLHPIYSDLSSDDLLQRCLGGHTQNNNESFNAVLWRLAPKHIFCSKKIVELAAFIAVCIFNEGITPVLRMMEVMGITIGSEAKIMANKKDMVRVKKADATHSASSKEARLARRLERTAQDELFEEEEGILYAPGIAD